MSTETPSEHDHRRSVGPDLIIPVAAVAFTLYYFSTIIDSPWTAQVSAFFIGTILLALCLVFIIKTILSLAQGTARFSFAKFVTRTDITSGRLAVFVLTILYIVVIEWLGFTLTTFAFLVLSMASLTKGKRLGTILVASLCLMTAGYLLFIVAFDTRFPRGPFEHLMQAMF